MPNFHPPFSAFPFALLAVAGILEIARLFFKREWIDHAITFTVALAGVFTVAAFFSGYSASEHANQTFSVPDGAIGGHHTAGRFLLFAMIPCVALRFAAVHASHGKLGFVTAYRLFLGLCMALVVYTGYLGGKLVFDHGAGVTAPLPAAPAPER